MGGRYAYGPIDHPSRQTGKQEEKVISFYKNYLVASVGKMKDLGRT